MSINETSKGIRIKTDFLPPRSYTEGQTAYDSFTKINR
jgi:hypothetical protein